MALQKAPPAEIRRRGIEALAKALGPVGLVRFLQQFELGSGDYTRDREEWLKGLTVAFDSTARVCTASLTTFLTRATKPR